MMADTSRSPSGLIQDSHTSTSALDAVRWIDLPSHTDCRGILTAIESGQDVPFKIRRVYLLHNLSADRGGHAHRDTHQLVIAASGSFDFILSDGIVTRTYHMDNPAVGLLVAPMLFIRLQNLSPDAVAVVLASTHYDKKRSIRSWEEYLEARGL